MKLNYKRLFILAGLISLIILLARGCLHACSRQMEVYPALPRPSDQAQKELTLHVESANKDIRIGLEDYLVGVVAAEMPSSFEEEALKAQAVAARTYTLKRIGAHACPSGCDLCSSSKCCQAYDTDDECRKKWGASYEKNIKKIQSAVYATAGEALYYEGALIEALYHAASGGQTEDSENVFAAAEPYLRGVSSVNEVGSSHITDETRISKKEFTKIINAAWPKAALKASSLEKQVKVLERYASGRVKSVKLGGVNATGRELRAALNLRSAWFYIEYQGDDVLVSTRGYGHGVGMSQAGANGMAKEGADYKEILAHYYSHTEIL